MIITYEKAEKYPCCVCIPEGTSWKLTADIEEMSEDAVCYVLRLVAGEFEDEILISEDVYGLINTGNEDTGEAVFSLFSQIVNNTAKELVRVVRNNELVVDIAKLVRNETAFWIRFWESINEQQKEVEEG